MGTPRQRQRTTRAQSTPADVEGSADPAGDRGVYRNLTVRRGHRHSPGPTWPRSVDGNECNEIARRRGDADGLAAVSTQGCGRRADWKMPRPLIKADIYSRHCI
ncbi:unnamed protein product [Lampetra planeri]